MTAADIFRGLAEIDFTTQPGADPNDAYQAAFPTFRKFAGGRDEVVLLRWSAASRRAIRLGPGGLEAWDENDVPAVFRAGDPKVAAFPTFTYGRSQNKRFMNIVELRSAAFRRAIAPAGTQNLTNLNMVESSMHGAHDWARANGFTAGFPTFSTTVGGGVELVVFPAPSEGIHVNSDPVPALPGHAPAPVRLWSFESLNILQHGGMALAAVGGLPVLLYEWDSVVGGGGGPSAAIELAQKRLTTTDTVSSALTNISEVAAVTTATDLHVLWADIALFHASRPLGRPNSWTFRTVSGRTNPEPTGFVGYFNSAFAAPDGTLHAFAYLSQPPGTAPGGTPDPNATHNLLHGRFDGTTWSVETVDGDGILALGHDPGDVGQASAGVLEPDGPLHVFYSLSGVADGAGTAQRLRHAEFRFQQTAAVWLAETLDGSGASTAPEAPGMGPTRASVGAGVTATFFDGSIWVVYEDRTWGNLRCARGTRIGGVLQWKFHVLDGGSHRGSTQGVVQSAVLLPWDDQLSVFYYDETRKVIRHAYRVRGAAAWTYELLDGAGGTDGRVAAPVSPTFTAAATAKPDGTPTTPIFVAYLWKPTPTASTPGVRIATLTWN